MNSGLQLLRGVAVMAAVFFHLFPAVFENGYLGVDVFFVISGFVMTPRILQIFQHKDRGTVWGRLTQFYTRRYLRLMPAFGTLILVFSILMVLFGPLVDHRSYAAQLIASILFLGNIEAYRQSQGDYFNPNPNPFLHTWSLSAEEQIYFILPIILLIIFIFTKRNQKLILIWIGISSYLLCVFLEVIVKLPSGLLFYLPLSRLWQFAIGGTVWFLVKKTKTSRYKHLFTVLNFLLISILFSKIKFGPVDSEITCALTGIYISQIRSQNIDGNTKVLSKIGDYSYSIYLLHLPLIYLILTSPRFSLLTENTKTILIMILLVVGSYFLHKMVENRFRRKNSSAVSLKLLAKSLAIFTILPLVVVIGIRVLSLDYYGITTKPLIQGTIECSKVGPFGECQDAQIKSQRRVLLVGDSHAASISRSFSAVSKSLKWNPIILSGRGCQLLYENERNKPSASNCEGFTKNVFNYLKKNPDTWVIVFQRSSKVSETNPPLEFNSRFIKTLGEIAKISENLTVLGPNPEFKTGGSQGDLLGLIQNQEFIEKAFMIQSSFQDDLFLANQLRNKKIDYVSTVDIFCTKTKCRYIKDRELLYWDDNHLSLSGAATLESQIANILNQFDAEESLQ